LTVVGEMERLAPAVVSYWRVVGFTRGVIALLFLGPIALPFALVDGGGRPLWYVGAGFLVVVGWGLWSLLTARLRYDRTAFRLDREQLLVRHGVVVHHELVVPVTRMQHVDIDRGPVERLFGIARLSVYTAGGRRATVQIPGLLPDRAAELRAFILDVHGEGGDG